MSLRRITSTLSSEFLLCLFLKNTINSQQSFCQRALLWSDTLCYPFILLFLYFWNVLKNLNPFKKIYRKLEKKKNHRNQVTEGPELFLEKQLLLALSLSGGCGRRGQNTENRGLAVRAPRLRDQVGHLPVTGPQAHRVPSSAPRPLSVKIPALPPSEDSWDN